MLTTFLLVNAVALAGVLLTARFDSRLVDDNGVAMDRNGPWHEQVVPAVTAATPEAVAQR